MASHPVSAIDPVSFCSYFPWTRIRAVLLACVVVIVICIPQCQMPLWLLTLRVMISAGSVLAVFSILEHSPRRLPTWLARWALRVIAVAVSVPLATALAYWMTSFAEPGTWYQSAATMKDFGKLAIMGLLIGPWMAIAALHRQVRGEAQRQALAFELQRSELERRELDTRMRLVNAQVEPHFLFNTLANVRELVKQRSPDADRVLTSLIAYLRAAVPQLQSPSSKVAQEVELSRAYLEVMHMRMPHRLRYSLEVDEQALSAFCPPTTLLTLVENAIKHGIDPSERGGDVFIDIKAVGDQCVLRVADTGVGLGRRASTAGTGLVALRERLRAAFGDRCELRLQPNEPRGAVAELTFPLVRSV